MSKQARNFLFGGLLILAGILFFLQQLLDWRGEEVIVGMLFGLGGLAFLFVLATNRQNWWAAFPAMALLGISALILTDTFAREFNNDFGGSIFLGSLAISFIIVFILNPSFWWAIIPAGALSTLALVASIQGNTGTLPGAVFFLGLAFTFGVLGLMPVGRKDKWPWIPAGILAVLSFALMFGAEGLVAEIGKYVFPVALLGVGGYLIFRSARKVE